MNETAIPAVIVDRLRSNLRAAGINVDVEDIDGMAEKGLLRNPVAFDELDTRFRRDLLPDYLWPWEPDAVETSGGKPAAAQSAPAAHQAAYPSIAATADQIRRRELSPVALTEAALERIRERDSDLNAFQLVLGDEALAAARTAESEIASGGYRGPLHGIPVAVKDLLSMSGTVATAGSTILSDRQTDFDAAGIEKLRAAGAVIVGKTRLPEFAYSPGSNNPHYGPTKNPWNRERDTGGSSSGSAAAVADGEVFAALGSDTGGSIRIPAALCGLVGLKPTFGRLSLYGAVPLAWSLDHLGPITRSVADAAIMLESLDGYDSRDARTPRSAPLVSAIEAGAQGIRIGVLREDGTGMPLGKEEALDAWRSGLEALEKAGAELIEIDLPEMRDLRVVNQALIALEACAYHEPWLRDRLHDYGEFARQRLLTSYAYGPGALARAQQARAAIRRRFDSIFDRVDLLSTPTVPYGAPALGTPAATVFTSPFNALGWPAISVPVGLAPGGLPIGLQLAGRPWDESTVLRAAAALEATGVWAGDAPAA